MTWTTLHGIRHILIQPGSLMQKDYIASLNRKLRYQAWMSNDLKPCHKPDISLLNGEKFTTKSSQIAVWGGFLLHRSPNISGFNSLPLNPTIINFRFTSKTWLLFNQWSTQGGRSKIHIIEPPFFLLQAFPIGTSFWSPHSCIGRGNTKK